MWPTYIQPPFCICLLAGFIVMRCRSLRLSLIFLLYEWEIMINIVKDAIFLFLLDLLTMETLTMFQISLTSINHTFVSPSCVLLERHPTRFSVYGGMKQLALISLDNKSEPFLQRTNQIPPVSESSTLDEFGMNKSSCPNCTTK